MDAFAFSPVARSEGISTAVLEAMSVGLPIVTTAVAGLPEAIEDGVNGVLVPHDHPEMMAEALVEILRDPGTAARMGRAARLRAVASFGIAKCVDVHVSAYDRAMKIRGGLQDTSTPREFSIDNVLVCPTCRRSLAIDRSSMTCDTCEKKYPVTDGIPILLPDAVDSDFDDVGHHGHRSDRADIHKATQAGHFDQAVATEFEITRPYGAPRLYRFLLLEKFRRATAPIGERMAGSSALTVCGGSGMDAEFLARAGATVVSSDISLEAARRTRERANRRGLNITPVVADAEHLPFADAAFDVVYVHDGLHHLEQPTRALREMARVAGHWVSVSEPARALATSVAVKAGIALEREEAGNVVRRLTTSEVIRTLAIAGYRSLLAQRYAMYYPHEPGPLFRVLSLPWIFPIARLAWRVGNAVLGRAGNKMVVVAERVGHTKSEWVPASEHEAASHDGPNL
jgi:ubiquinone/menaquinone biosynthesis C-methylase UbiE/uncharacterized protein YbaR (Trm112 family)